MNNYNVNHKLYVIIYGVRTHFHWYTAQENYYDNKITNRLKFWVFNEMVIYLYFIILSLAMVRYIILNYQQWSTTRYSLGVIFFNVRHVASLPKLSFQPVIHC